MVNGRNSNMHQQQIPASLPHPRQQQQQQLNPIESWDSLCPLSNLERQSIHLIQKAVDDKPLPPTLTLKNHSLSQLAASPPSTRSNSPHSNSLRRLLLQPSSTHPHPANLILDQYQLHNHLPPSSPSAPQSPSLQNQLDNHVHQPISSIDRFNDWFSVVSSHIEADSESDYLNHLAVLSTYSNACDSLDRVIDDCRGLLNEIDANWKFVNDNSKSIERSCEGMLNDQKVLSGLASALHDRLEYFRKLDYAQKVLSRPGQAQIVNDPEFLPMISSLDVCLEFMKSNRHFRDADLYLVRFQQCLTRSMTLIKLHYTNQIQTLGKQVNEKLNQINQQSTTSTSTNNLQIEESLLYEKFQNLSNELRPLIIQIEKRFEFDKLEYGDVLNEIFQTWFSVRNMLLNSRIKIEINRIQISHEQVPDLISLTTTGCNFLRSICLAEWKIFKSFFPRTGEEELFAYLESLSDYLYDLLRPQILHEQKLDLLCDLATIMNALIAIDSELMDESESDRNASSAFKFSTLLRPILQDIQTRLIFRAQAIIQSDVENYQPKPLDLDYPNKLVKKTNGENLDRKPTLKSSRVKSQTGESRLHSKPNPNLPLKFRLPDQETQETWYPTLRKTLWVLAKLHTYVNDAIFEDFAGEAVGICSESIIKASKLMKINPRPESNTSTTSKIITQENEWSIDRELFVIRHLLILKEMIRTLDVAQVERAVDLGPITDVLKDILNPSLKDSLIFRPITLINKLKNLNSIKPIARQFINDKPVEDQHLHSASLYDEDNANNQSLIKTIDSKSELDQKLKSICTSFILKSSSLITMNSIDPFLGKCEKILNFETSSSQEQNSLNAPRNLQMVDHGNLKRKNLLEEEWSSKDSILTLFHSFLKDLNVGLRSILNRLVLYFPTTLDDHDAQDLTDLNLINVLFPCFQEEIMEKYTRFFNLINSELSELDLIIDINRYRTGNNVEQTEKEKEKENEIKFDDNLFALNKILFPFHIKSIIQQIVYDFHHSSTLSH